MDKPTSRMRHLLKPSHLTRNLIQELHLARSLPVRVTIKNKLKGVADTRALRLCSVGKILLHRLLV